MKKLTLIIAAAIALMTSCSKKSNNTTTNPATGLETYTKTSASGDAAVLLTKDTSSGQSVLSVKVAYLLNDTSTVSNYDSYMLNVNGAYFQGYSKIGRAAGDTGRFTYNAFPKGTAFQFIVYRQTTGNDTVVTISGN